MENNIITPTGNVFTEKHRDRFRQACYGMAIGLIIMLILLGYSIILVYGFLDVRVVPYSYRMLIILQLVPIVWRIFVLLCATQRHNSFQLFVFRLTYTFDQILTFISFSGTVTLLFGYSIIVNDLVFFSNHPSTNYNIVLFFMLCLFFAFSCNQIYISSRISFIISKPRAKRISFFLELILITTIAIFFIADARFYMEYSLCGSLFFKSLIAFAWAFILITTAFSGFLGYIFNSHLLLEIARILSIIVTLSSFFYEIFLVLARKIQTESYVGNWVIFRNILKMSFNSYNDPVEWESTIRHDYWLVLFMQSVVLTTFCFLSYQCADMYKMLKEYTIFSYFCIIDFDRDGVLGRRDLASLFSSLQMTVSVKEIDEIIKRCNGIEGITFGAFKTIMFNEKAILERVDADVLHSVLENGDSVAETEVYSLRTYLEPVTILFRGVHEIEIILRQRKGLRHFLSVILGITLFTLFTVVLLLLTKTELFVQYCGVVSTYYTTNAYNSTQFGKPETIEFQSAFPRGFITFQSNYHGEVELSVTRYSFVSEVMEEDDYYSGVSFAYSKSRWMFNVWFDNSRLSKFTQTTLFNTYGTACLNEVSSVEIPLDLYPDILLTLTGVHYDVVMVFPERCYVKSVSIEQQLGRIEFISVDVMEDAVISSNSLQGMFHMLSDTSATDKKVFLFNCTVMNLSLSQVYFNYHSLQISFDEGMVSFFDSQLYQFLLLIM